MQVQHVEPHDDLFDLGATSIEVIRIVNLMEQELGFRPKIEAIYRSSMVSDLAEFYQQHLLQTSLFQEAHIAATQGNYEVSERACLMHEAFFFGPSNRQLFANYHPPVHGSGRVLTVLCPPLLRDYTRTQPALRRLAISLAERGQHVLRFDYRGTGDSFGDLGDATVSDWVEDITLAVQEGRSLSDCSVVRLLGVRAGALLVCKSMGATNNVERLVLWDPVPNGTGYLQAMRRIQLTTLRENANMGRAQRVEAMHQHDYAGYRLSERMVKEFGSLDSGVYSSIPKSKLHIVRTWSPNEFTAPGVSHDVVQVASSWEIPAENLTMPRPVLERLLKCLTMS